MRGAGYAGRGRLPQGTRSPFPDRQCSAHSPSHTSSPGQEHRDRPGGGSNRESLPPAALRPPPQGFLLTPALGAGTGKGREGPDARVHKCARASVPGRGPRAAGRMLTRARDVHAGTGGRRQNREGGWQRTREERGGEQKRGAEQRSRAAAGSARAAALSARSPTTSSSPGARPPPRSGHHLAGRRGPGRA